MDPIGACCGVLAPFPISGLTSAARITTLPGTHYQLEAFNTSGFVSFCKYYPGICITPPAPDPPYCDVEDDLESLTCQYDTLAYKGMTCTQ